MSIKKHTLYDCFYFLLILFPLILCVASYLSDGNVALTLHDAVGEVFDVVSNGDNAIYTTLHSIFCVGTYSTGGLSEDIVAYISYFVCIELLRLYIEFILLLPRICRKFMNVGNEVL